LRSFLYLTISAAQAWEPSEEGIDRRRSLDRRTKEWGIECKNIGRCGQFPCFCRKSVVAPATEANASITGAARTLRFCLPVFDTTSPGRAATWTVRAHITGLSPLRGSLEAAYRSIIVGWRDHGGDSLPKLSWPEWVSLCTLLGRPLMRSFSAQVVFAHSAWRWLRQLIYSSCRIWPLGRCFSRNKAA